MKEEGDLERELDKRVEDLHEIRKLLAEGNEIPLIHPWAFLVWGLLVGAGAIVHYLLFLRANIEVKTALVWIWLPVLIVGGAVEATSWAIRISRESLPLLNRRVGSAILAAIAAVIVITVGMIRLALTTLTPGLGILVGSLPLIFYAQTLLLVPLHRNLCRYRRGPAIRVRGRPRSPVPARRRPVTGPPLHRLRRPCAADRAEETWLILSPASTGLLRKVPSGDRGPPLP